MEMDYDELELEAEELEPLRPYTPERAAEIAELNSDIASAWADLCSMDA